MSLDIAIVGGGPAGLVTALHAARAGMRVRLFERRTPPVDKPCGEGIMPTTVRRLRKLGVDLSSADTQPFQGIRYRDGNGSAEGKFRGFPGRGCRRTILHQLLVDRLRDTDVNAHWGERVIQARPGELQTDRDRYHTDWIVGADGLHSRVRNWMGVRSHAGTVKRFGTVRHYKIAPWTNYVEIYWGGPCEAYVTPVRNQEVCVALLHGPERRDFDSMLARIPNLRDRLSSAAITVDERGWGPLYQQPGDVLRNNMALVGDASGYRGAITGEGLSLAFEEARVLVDSLQSGNPGRYRREHGRIARLPNRLLSLAVLLRDRPRLRSILIGALGSPSRVLSYLVNLNDRGAEIIPSFLQSMVPLPTAG